MQQQQQDAEDAADRRVEDLPKVHSLVPVRQRQDLLPSTTATAAAAPSLDLADGENWLRFVPVARGNDSLLAFASPLGAAGDDGSQKSLLSGAAFQGSSAGGGGAEEDDEEGEGCGELNLCPVVLSLQDLPDSDFSGDDEEESDGAGNGGAGGGECCRQCGFCDRGGKPSSSHAAAGGRSGTTGGAFLCLDVDGDHLIAKDTRRSSSSSSRPARRDGHGDDIHAASADGVLEVFIFRWGTSSMGVPSSWEPLRRRRAKILRPRDRLLVRQVRPVFALPSHRERPLDGKERQQKKKQRSNDVRSSSSSSSYPRTVLVLEHVHETAIRTTTANGNGGSNETAEFLSQQSHSQLLHSATADADEGADLRQKRKNRRDDGGDDDDEKEENLVEAGDDGDDFAILSPSAARQGCADENEPPAAGGGDDEGKPSAATAAASLPSGAMGQRRRRRDHRHGEAEGTQERSASSQPSLGLASSPSHFLFLMTQQEPAEVVGEGAAAASAEASQKSSQLQPSQQLTKRPGAEEGGKEEAETERQAEGPSQDSSDDETVDPDGGEEAEQPVEVGGEAVGGGEGGTAAAAAAASSPPPPPNEKLEGPEEEGEEGSGDAPERPQEPLVAAAQEAFAKAKPQTIAGTNEGGTGEAAAALALLRRSSSDKDKDKEDSKASSRNAAGIGTTGDVDGRKEEATKKEATSTSQVPQQPAAASDLGLLSQEELNVDKMIQDEEKEGTPASPSSAAVGNLSVSARVDAEMGGAKVDAGEDAPAKDSADDVVDLCPPASKDAVDESRMTQRRQEEAKQAEGDKQTDDKVSNPPPVATRKMDFTADDDDISEPLPYPEEEADERGNLQFSPEKTVADAGREFQKDYGIAARKAAPAMMREEEEEVEDPSDEPAPLPTYRRRKRRRPMTGDRKGSGPKRGKTAFLEDIDFDLHKVMKKHKRRSDEDTDRHDATTRNTRSAAATADIKSGPPVEEPRSSPEQPERSNDGNKKEAGSVADEKEPPVSSDPETSTVGASDVEAAPAKQKEDPSKNKQNAAVGSKEKAAAEEPAQSTSSILENGEERDGDRDRSNGSESKPDRVSERKESAENEDEKPEGVVEGSSGKGVDDKTAVDDREEVPSPPATNADQNENKNNPLRRDMETDSESDAMGGRQKMTDSKSADEDNDKPSLPATADEEAPEDGTTRTSEEAAAKRKASRKRTLTSKTRGDKDVPSDSAPEEKSPKAATPPAAEVMRRNLTRKRTADSAEKMTPSTKARDTATTRSTRKRTRRTPLRGVAEEADDDSAAGDEEEPVRVLTTCVDLSTRQKSMVRQIGGVLLNDVSMAHTATHVIASDGKESLKRTPKLMIALQRTPNIIVLDWLTDSAKAKKVLPVDKYLLLNDSKAEEKYSFNMRTTLDRIKTNIKNRTSLLGGLKVFVCDGVAGKSAPPKKELKLIVESAGGEWVSNNLRTIPEPADKLIIITGSEPKDAKQQTRKKAVQAALDMGATQRTTSWLFQSIMTQELVK